MTKKYISDFKSEFKRYLKIEKYLVEDIGCTNPRILFILESPHNSEINEKYPAAGKSGKAMTEFISILNSNESLGKIVSNKSNQFLEMGIMNVCQVPLQCVNDLDKSYKKLVNKLNSIIKKGYKSFGKHKKNQQFNCIEKIILKNFIGRLKKMNLDNTLVVVCGKFAETYFKKYLDAIKMSYSNLIYVPHPSYNQWETNFNSLLELKKELKTRLEI